MFLYIFFNLIEGDRGLLSYYKNLKLKNELVKEKKILTSKLHIFEKENNLLTDNIDLDYLEIQYRTMFMFGKIDEKIFTNIKK